MSGKKNPHAVALGRVGGSVGGTSRSDAKIKASKLNGRLGGRPKKKMARIKESDAGLRAMRKGIC